MNSRPSLPFSPMPLEDETYTGPDTFSQYYQDLINEYWVVEPSTSAMDAEKAGPASDELADESKGWKPTVTPGCIFDHPVAAMKQEDGAAIREGFHGLESVLPLGRETMSPPYGSLARVPGQHQTTAMDDDYAKLRQRMEKLGADFRRMQKLENQARSRLDRVRQMKDQVTEKMQVTQQQVLDRLSGGITSLPLKPDPSLSGTLSMFARDGAIKSESLPADIEEAEALDHLESTFYLNPSLSSELRTTPASSQLMFGETHDRNTEGLHSDSSDTTRHRTMSTYYGAPPALLRPSVLTPLKRKEEPNYQFLERDASPQIDDAEAIAIILGGRLKGNARHRAGPNYFRRKGLLYADRYYLLELRDDFGNLIIGQDKTAGCFDTARYRHRDELEGGLL